MKIQEKKNLEYLTKRAGLYLQELVQDDGTTRYRFFRMPPICDGYETGLYTGFELDEALAFIAGVNTGLDEAIRRIMKELDIE